MELGEKIGVGGYLGIEWFFDRGRASPPHPDYSLSKAPTKIMGKELNYSCRVEITGPHEHPGFRVSIDRGRASGEICTLLLLSHAYALKVYIYLYIAGGRERNQQSLYRVEF